MFERFLKEKKVPRMDHQLRNAKIERARKLGRKASEEIGKEESNDSPEIPDMGLTSDIRPASLRGVCSIRHK